MLENPSNAAVAAATESATIVKRYAPPNQRSRLHRRKSADRSDRTNNVYGNDVDKNQVSGSRNVPVIDHGDAGGSSLLNEKPRARLIALEGCSSSEASQLLNERWAATMQFYNDSTVEQPGRVTHALHLSVCMRFEHCSTWTRALCKAGTYNGLGTKAQMMSSTGPSEPAHNLLRECFVLPLGAIHICHSDPNFSIKTSFTLCFSNCVPSILLHSVIFSSVSEKPVMCSDKASSAWGGQFRLPHQFMTPTGRPGSPGSQMDFLGELRRAISNFSASFDS
ncbi:hypothetical protein F8388_018374 [Cannabis sativa]|uniref:Uncharacterized protein n=1 Tax=Cannabis sativa TaxID=3483 RepID=A0A7J6HEW1_CANSA|nr:hypothetical protein F8388_018374 [Cannabis sativa]